MTYRRTYRLLCTAGHSPAKAAQIVLDAMRGQRTAIDWIRLLRRHARRGGIGAMLARLSTEERAAGSTQAQELA